MKIKIPVEIIIPDGEDCTYNDNYTLSTAFECKYFEMKFNTIPQCMIFVENHQFAKLEERISGGVKTGYKKCEQCLSKSLDDKNNAKKYFN